jgi:hypothetical protein
MKTIIVTDIVYNFNNKEVDPYTLPTDMMFVVDNNFNKYVDVAKLIKEQTTFLPKSYSIKEDNDIKKYIHIDENSVYSLKESESVENH